MANPRRKWSKSRSRQRRAKYYSSLTARPMMECPNCGTVKLLHHACPSCGHYRGRQVIETKGEVV